MTLKLACSSLCRVERILKNGVFTGKLGIFPQVQPTSIRSRPFADGPSFDAPPQGFEQPVDPKENLKTSVVITTEEPMSFLSPGGWWGGQGGDTRKSSGPGSGGEGENMEEFMKITLTDFAENFLLQPTTVKNLTFFSSNFVRVEMRPGASEDDGEILWFQIANLEDEEGDDEKIRMFILSPLSFIFIAGLIGGCCAFI